MAKIKKEKLYQVHNLTRSVATRLTRAKAARRTRMTLLLSGGDVRIPRGRHAIIAEPKLLRMVAELQKKEAEGALKVTTITGQRVDLTTLKVTEGLSTVTKPNPPEDSASKDKTFEHGVGEGMSMLEGGKTLQDDVKVPEVLRPEIPEGIEEPVDYTQLVYDSATAKVLAAEADKMGIPTDGSKRDVAARLAAAGYRPA